jgi:hypothetical protein
VHPVLCDSLHSSLLIVVLNVGPELRFQTPSHHHFGNTCASRSAIQLLEIARRTHLSHTHHRIMSDFQPISAMVRATAVNINNAPLLDLAPGSFHTGHLIHDPSHYGKRISDHIFVAFMLGKPKYFTRTPICEKHPMVFAQNLRIRPTRVHEGRPALDPYGRLICIPGAYSTLVTSLCVFNGGDETLERSLLSWDELKNDLKYVKWRLRYFYGGRSVNDGTYLTRNDGTYVFINEQAEEEGSFRRDASRHQKKHINRHKVLIITHYLFDYINSGNN